MGWKIGLPYHWPHDNPRRSMSHCPSCNGLPSEGEGARTSMCKSASPATLQVWPSERFPCKGCLQRWWLWLSTITMSAPRGQDCNRHPRDQRSLSPQFPSSSPDCGFKSNRKLIINGFLDVVQVWQVRWILAREMALRGWSSHEEKPPCLQRWGC